MNKYKIINNYNYFIKFFPKIINTLYKKKIEIIDLNVYKIDQLQLIFILPSKIQNINRFIIILICIEKLFNNKVIFLYDKKTLSKYIKIGCLLNIENEFLMQNLNVANMHNVQRIHNKLVTLKYKDNQLMDYTTNKIISNYIFNIKKDIINYYDYIAEFNYNCTILYNSKINSIMHTCLILNILGLYVFNTNNGNNEKMINDTWNNIIRKENEYKEIEEFDDVKKNISARIEIQNKDKIKNKVIHLIGKNDYNMQPFNIMEEEMYTELIDYYI